MTVVVPCAGFSTRFNGEQKILIPMNDSGETLLEFTLYDLFRLGCDRVILIVREEEYKAFRNKLERHIFADMKVEYVFDTRGPSLLSKGVLGSGYALLLAQSLIKENEPFFLINGAVYYGYDILSKMQCRSDEASFKEQKSYFLAAGFHLGNCLSSKGPISTEIILENDGLTREIRYYPSLFVSPDFRSAEYREDDVPYTLPLRSSALMGLYVLKSAVFPYLRQSFELFLSQKEKYKDKEFSVADALSLMLKEDACEVEICYASQSPIAIHTTSEVPYTRRRLAQRTLDYPKPLWE